MTYDVLILGSGLAGSTIAAILARHGHSVLMVEKGRHPRFALGEATLPQTSHWLWLISERYDVPEIKLLADARTISSGVAPTSGMKHSLGFVYHRAGAAHDMVNDSHQLLAPELPFVSESHLYREDIDHYMATVAQKYGATLLEDTEIAAVHVSDKAVTLTDTAGTEHQGRYLVDASSASSVVTSTFGLREEPTRLKTQSRSIFTHVDGLKPYDDLFTAQELPGLKYRWHDGTLHHIFDGGWMWVIPFGNHEKSCNSKASIGLTLDMTKFPPRDDLTAEQEFHEIVNRFPSIAAHMQGTTATRPYIRTGRLQYSCDRAVGDRFFVTPQAYGAVDPLYSRGLINSFEMTFHFAHRLMDALHADDFGADRFEGLDQLARTQLDRHDDTVHNAYRAFSDFEAWSAWQKVWLAAKLLGDVWLLRANLRYQGNRDAAEFDWLEHKTPPYAQPLQRLVESASAALGEAADGRRSWASASALIHDHLGSVDWLPDWTFSWGDPTAHHTDFTPAHVMPMTILWGKVRAPRWERRHLFDFPARPLAKAILADKWKAIGAAKTQRRS